MNVPRVLPLILLLALGICLGGNNLYVRAESDASDGNNIWVSPTGDDARSGKSSDQAVRSAKRILELAKPGTVFHFQPGRYPKMTFKGLRGLKSSPITLQPSEQSNDNEDGDRHTVIFTSGTLEHGTGLVFADCKYVVIRGFEVTNSLKGIGIQNSSHCVLENNWCHDFGTEAIHVGRGPVKNGSKKFDGPASHHVTVANNRVARTGQTTAQYGEGIYIGTGATSGDNTHDIIVEGNTLTDISAEAIEVKPGTYNVVVRDNDISNTHHKFNAAITVCVEGTTGRSGNYLIENNRIKGVRKIRYRVAGIAIGHGNAIVRGNEISDVDGGVGIQVYHRFQNANALEVEITGNTVWTSSPAQGIKLHQGNSGQTDSPLTAIVTMSDNKIETE